MDILESLTTDFDQLRDLTIDLSIATTTGERESAFRQLSRLQDVSMKAQISAMTSATSSVEALEFAKRKMLERADLLDDIATALHRTRQPELREAKMELYSDLVLQSITDCEREILPYIYENVTETERRQMGRSYEKYRNIALDYPFAS